MKNIAGIIILYIVIFSIISCFPNGDFHSLVNITLTNQSSYNVDFYTRRIGEAEEISYTEHGD